MNIAPGFWPVVKREVNRLTSRPIYLTGIVLIPVFMAVFFISLLGEGLPRRVPVGIVDLDHTELSRQVTRSLDAMEQIAIATDLTSYNEAMDAVQRGEIFGFFVIPEDFQKEAIGGRGPTLTFYSNLTYYIPGTLVFKGFKTLAVTTSGKLVQTDLVAKGVSSEMAGTILQPMTIQTHPLNNPWTNYSYYLSPSFIYGVIELMIFIMTIFSIGQEIKYGSSVEWLSTACNRIGTAVIGKLFPQTVIFCIIGFGVNSLMFRWCHFPMHGSEWNMAIGMFLFVIASQSFAVAVCSLIPNLRLALSAVCLTGILAFSIAAFSFPLEAMYGWIAIFAGILPSRWYFLIYIDQALNGIPLYFSRYYYAALLVFPIIAVFASPLLKRAARKPVYIP